MKHKILISTFSLILMLSLGNFGQVLANLKSTYMAGKKDEFGQRYTVDFTAEKDGKNAVIRSGWIIEEDSDVPKLTTCFII